MTAVAIEKTRLRSLWNDLKKWLAPNTDLREILIANRIYIETPLTKLKKVNTIRN